MSRKKPDRNLINICVLGVGNLGVRHYQALLNIDFGATLYLVDPDVSIYERLGKPPFSDNVKHMETQIFQSINDLPEYIDLAIIATNSDIRANVTKELISGRIVKNILFEKVLFQSRQEYQEVEILLANYGIRAWVNCPRRLYPYNQEIKKTLVGKPVNCKVVGWEIACNSIHFIDFLEWVNGEFLENVTTKKLERKIIESKRSGFVEFSGEIIFEFGGGSRLCMQSPIGGRNIKNIEISSGEYKYELDEVNNVCVETFGETTSTFKIKPLYQSQLTNIVARQIIFEGKSDLVNYEDSMRQHIKLTDAFKHHIEAIDSTFIVNDRVPVT